MPEDGSRARPIPHWASPGGAAVEIVEGDGARVVDSSGRTYLDFVGQLYCSNLGHSNAAVIEAMTEQLARIPYVSSAKHNDTRSRLAARLGEIAPGDLDSVLFAVSGSEANEAAIQLAREYTGRHTVLTRWRSYHGATYGAGELTGDPTTRATLAEYASTTGVTKFLPPVAYRSPFDADTPEELADQAASHLEYVIRNEGADSIAAILTEPIGGTSGAYPAPPGYFEQVRELCDTYDILLISDEVITGFGRCGAWFGIETEGVVPDMLTFAKGITGAYAPLAGVLAREEIGSAVLEEGLEVGQTFAGHPVACAAGIAAIDEYRSGLLDAVRELAPYFEERLGTVAAEHDAVGDYRGRGLLWAVEFTDPSTGDPFVHPWIDDADNPVADVIDAAAERGLLVGKGRPGYQLILSPPFCVSRDDVDEGLAALDAAIDAVF